MPPSTPTVDSRTEPAQYRHWSFTVEGAIARTQLNIAEDGGIRPGYKLKLNSYDLGVDIELHDALNRIRFEHPQVRTVIVTSGRDRIFCSGANIFMLGVSSHAWKVNFCKFTNETRNGIEDSSRHSGLKFLAAVNGACAGGGYELALACDDIVLIDDRSSAVSLPERSEEHTSELQSHSDLVCRLLLEKKKDQRHGSEYSTTSATAHSPA